MFTTCFGNATPTSGELSFLQLLYMHYIFVIVTITALKFVSAQVLKKPGH